MKWEPHPLPQPTPFLLGAALILRRWGLLLTPLVPSVATHRTLCPLLPLSPSGPGRQLARASCISLFTKRSLVVCQLLLLEQLNRPGFECHLFSSRFGDWMSHFISEFLSSVYIKIRCLCSKAVGIDCLAAQSLAEGGAQHM